MQSTLGSDLERSQDLCPSAPCALWPVDLKLTHLDWNPEAILIHFQGQYLTICELDYSILQGEIQNVPKSKAEVDIGEFCLVEDLTSARWYRGRVQKRRDDFFDVFLIDHGNVLTVSATNVSSCSNDLFILPPKIVCGFLANVLLLQSCSHSVVEEYFSSLIGRNINGYIQALLPHKVLLLEAPDINTGLVTHGFGRYVDTDTFLFLVEILTEMPLKQKIEPVPDLLIEKPRGQEVCFKPSGLQGYEGIFSLYGPALCCGTRAKVRVTAAVSPGLFYCQMASVEAELWEMSKKLAASCECRPKESYQMTPENLGLLSSAKSKDGRWYRGLVQFLPGSSWVRVLFVDYGFFESVTVENIHRLAPELYSTPIMSFPCSLACLTDEDKAIKTQQLCLLKSGLLGGRLHMEITRYDEEHHLYCVTIISAEDEGVEDPEPVRRCPVMKVESVSEAEEQGGFLYHETIMGETLGQTLKVEEVQVDSVFVGYVEHVQNPNHFWIRTQKRNEEFEEMMSKMAEHFQHVKLDEDVLLNPKLGTLCCAVYEGDMHFYRGVVTDALKHGAEVLFIDFGNIEKVPHMLIKKIPESFARKAAFAICCTLSNVFPVEDIWTSSASDSFRRAVSNKALLVHVVQMRKNKFVVDLFEMGSGNNQSITELLVSSKQAEYILKGHLAQKRTEKTRCPQSNVKTNITEDKGQWQHCKEEEKASNNEPEKGQPLASIKPLNIKPGCELTVHCSYISSPSDFWCQPQDMVPALEELMDKIQQYYSTHWVPLESGDSCCIAKSPQDGRWYRALITAKQRSNATVTLVDYGNTVQVSEHILQAIMPEFIYLEGQAFRCSLYDLIEPADPKNSGNWSPEGCRLLKDFVFSSTGALKCKVVSQLYVKNKGLCNVVDLYNSQTQQSVTDTFTEQGLATRVTASTRQQRAVFPESFIYSSHDLHPGNEEQMYVTYVNSQWEVYCHLERNTDIIVELEKKISEESKHMMQVDTRAVVSKMCLARYFDGKWYRGVVHPIHSPLHFSVFFVDYGNTSISEKTKVMFIPRDSSDLLYTPMQAVRCCLHSVSKKDVYADVKEWLSSAVLNKQVKAVILGKNEDGSFDVELFDGDMNINEKVKELILSLSCKPKTAVRFEMINRKQKTSCKRNTKSSFKSKSHPKVYSNLSTLSTVHRGTKKRENTKTLVGGRTQNKNTRVRTQNEGTLNTRASVKSQNNQVKQRQEQKQAQQKEAKEIPLVLPDKKICAGFRAKCFVSHADSIYSFFLQLSEDEPAILEMGEALNSSTLRESLKMPPTLRINDIVLAEFEEDGALYRSVVKNFAGNSCFKVEFVDYGNSAVVEKKKIFSIPKEHLSHPRFSIPCSLLDPSTFRNDVAFTDAVMEKPLMVEFIEQCGTKWDIKIKVLDGEVGLNAGPVTEREDESPNSEANEKLRSHKQNNQRDEACKNEIRSEIKITTVKCETFTPKPPSVKVLVPMRMKTYRCRRIRVKSNKSKTTKRFGNASLTPSIQARDSENGMLLSVQSNGCFYSYSGFAAAIKTPSDFCVSLEDLLLVTNKVSVELDDLPSQLIPLPEDHIAPGTCCLLKSDSRNKWCRAEIVHVNTTVVLNLVDYGHYECMPYDDCSNLKKLPVKITTLPKVTYSCILRGVKPAGLDGQWPDEAVVFFQQCLYEKNLQIFFREFVSNTHWKVDILVDGVHVAKELVDAGHASYVDVMLGLRFLEQNPFRAHSSDSEEQCGPEEEGSCEA
ncbi:tudor domain-containing protein 15 [Pelmatolapia mariae]|uniref:tudor domain-containing protein 15 n=1 Tax=Pelmatolapia mariae TaxID=158779 RepID=UPI002FE53B85